MGAPRIPRSKPGPSRLGLALLFLVPALHPVFIPLVGPPSHLLWWVHVLPVALLTFHGGRSIGWVAVSISGLWVAVGELLFGAGYGNPATPQTVLLLAVAVTATNALVAWFALYARSLGRRYRILTENLTMGVLLVDGSARILSANPAVREMLGDEAMELRGLPLADVLSVPRVKTLDDLAALGGWTGEIRLRSQGGDRPIPAFVAAIPEPEGDRHQVLVLDRSLEVARERELERQGKLAALGEALAGVAHELNNPLTAILAHAELGATCQEDAEVLDVVREQAERMHDLIRELLGFSRDESSGEKVELGPLVERLVRVQRMAIPTGVTLEHSLEYEGPVQATAAKVEQILLNLVSNASYEVARDGGGRVRLITRGGEDDVRIMVVDEGPGIPEELLPTLFEPFVTTKAEGEGTGLGLAIARRLARGWGGTLRAENRPEGGARLTLSLPIATDGPEPVATPTH